MDIKIELVKRQVGGEYFLVPLGKAVYSHNGLFVLTELGAFIWDLLPSVNSEEEILNAVLDTYEVDEETAAVDIKAFMKKIKDMGII